MKSLVEIYEELLTYKDDPDEFRAYIERTTEEYINSLPKERQERAQCQQWRIDQELNKCKDQTQRYNRMVELFWEGVGSFINELNSPSKPQTKSNIVEFDKKP